MAKRRIYIPINDLKYSGRHPIVLKSSWEENFARVYCDMNPACVDWAYEPWRIPYRDPLTGRQTIYIPDFLMSFQSTSGIIQCALIEVKPISQTLHEHARSDRDTANVARNLAKWEAAKAWCERRKNVKFCVITEKELFAGGQNIKPKKKRAYVQRRIKK